MRSYQLTYLISSQLEEKEVKILQEEISSLIQKEEGILIESDSPIKKSTAYPIKNPASHTRQQEVYLITFNFKLNPEKLKEIEQKLKSNEKILRYLLITKKILKKIPETSLKKPIKIVKPKKVEFKEIEQKLEEILGE